MRSAAGLCPDPLGGYSAPPDSLAVTRGEREGLGIGRGGREVRERIGMEGGRERGQEKGRDGSIWIFIQGPRVSSYATGMEEENGSAVTKCASPRS